MRELIEVLLSIAVPTAALVGYALILARREDRESRGEAAGRRSTFAPDPDAHLGRVGAE